MKLFNVYRKVIHNSNYGITRQVWGLMVHMKRYASKSTSTFNDAKSSRIDLSTFPVERIRNFSIIAHVDHGKSTLADRLLELTGTISMEQKNEQVLDKLQVERERGITVKAQTASLIWEHHDGHRYLLNLIDTPGHVDFNYEVSRSLAACQGVVLLIDANQGVQAQTVANFYLAFEAELAIVPVMNKIDLKVARPDEVHEQITSMFDFKREEVLRISAKTGLGVEALLETIIEKLPAPNSKRDAPFKALLFDSTYDKFKGAVANLAVLDGSIKKGDKVSSAYTGKSYEVTELGIMHPHETKTMVLYAGQVGYMYCGMKKIDEAQVGDTFFEQGKPVEALPGFRPAKPMVFAGIYPMDQSEFNNLRSAMEKLTLNDSSVQVNIDSSAALGQGWRLGFLGLLHMDVFQQRLDQEHNASVIITTPNVPYKVKIYGQKNIKQYGTDELTILNPCHMPDPQIITEYREPTVLSTIISPDTYLGDMLAIIMERRGQMRDQTYIDSKRIMFKVIFPLSEVIVDFFDELKSISSGYASFDYEDYGYETSNLVKIEVYINGKPVEELTQMAHVSKARTQSKRIVTRLKEAIPPQLFLITIQAKIGQKVLAREDVKALRKDVLAKCYGGDISRKMKLLRNQAEGKKRMRMIGNVNVPKEAFVAVLKK